MAKVVTLEGTSNSALYDMTLEIPEGATFVLKQARVEISHTTILNTPREINVKIGGIIGETFVIDNDSGYNFLKVGLNYNPVVNGGAFRTISVTYPDIAFKATGRMNKMTQVDIFDENHIPHATLVYYSLQFVVV